MNKDTQKSCNETFYQSFRKQTILVIIIKNPLESELKFFFKKFYMQLLKSLYRETIKKIQKFNSN